MSANNYSDMVVIAGDWHGNVEWATYVITKLNGNFKYILHVGDFGWDNTTDYLDKLNAKCEETDAYIIVTDGNHENFDYIDQCVTETVPEPWVDSGCLTRDPRYKRILRASRPMTWSWYGFGWASVGGANSINFESLTNHFDWWKKESITQGEMYKVSQIDPKTVDVLITHDAPIDLAATYEKPFTFSEKATAYANESAAAIKKVYNHLKPHIGFHGHYHLPKRSAYPLERPEIRNVDVYSLDKEYTSSNLLMVNTLTMNIIPLVL